MAKQKKHETDRSGVLMVMETRQRHRSTAVSLLSLLKRHYTEHGNLVDDAAMGTVIEALSREFYSGLQVEPLARPERQVRALRKELAVVSQERTALFMKLSLTQGLLDQAAEDRDRALQAQALLKAARRKRAKKGR